MVNPTMGKLTTHILDTAHGKPAAGVAIELYQVDPAQVKTLVKTVLTNIDGRTELPILSEQEFQPGLYELVFSMGEYFQRFLAVAQPTFLDRIAIQFRLTDNETYHLPLLISPWAYSTYRGS
jgi:5-hydroxyisourate hydrolase